MLHFIKIVEAGSSVPCSAYTGIFATYFTRIMKAEYFTFTVYVTPVLQRAVNSQVVFKV